MWNTVTHSTVDAQSPEEITHVSFSFTFFSCLDSFFRTLHPGLGSPKYARAALGAVHSCWLIPHIATFTTRAVGGKFRLVFEWYTNDTGSCGHGDSWLSSEMKNVLW